jgi:hypothetical protein
MQPTTWQAVLNSNECASKELTENAKEQCKQFENKGSAN